MPDPAVESTCACYVDWTFDFADVTSVIDWSVFDEGYASSESVGMMVLEVRALSYIFWVKSSCLAYELLVEEVSTFFLEAFFIALLNKAFALESECFFNPVFKVESLAMSLPFLSSNWVSLPAKAAATSDIEAFSSA